MTDEQGRPPPSDDLARLRQTIRTLDERLIDLAAERLRLAREIGAVKLAAGLPIKDFRVEKDVLERARKTARDRGVYENLAVDLAQVMIRYAVAAQDEYHRRDRSSRTTPHQQILIVGGRGRMGQWLSDYFAGFGHAVTHYDPTGVPADRDPGRWPVATDLALAAKAADIIILSAPISATARLIEAVAATGTKALVFDICSLKSPIIPALTAAAAAGVRIASAHPMFGPSAEVLAGRNILVCHVHNREATQAVRELFAGSTASLWEVPVADHDRLMSQVLGLSHLTNLLFARALATSGVPPRDLAAAASTTFSAQLAVARDVSLENPDLYYEIQAENAASAGMLASLDSALKDYARAIRAHDREAFRGLMADGAAYLSNLDKTGGNGNS